MKKSALSILFILLSPHLHAWSGGDAVRTGGDGIAQQFMFEARSTIAILETATLESRLTSLVQVIKKNIESVVVHSTDEVLTVDSIVVDAVNDRSLNTIMINRARWKEKGTLKRSEIAALILHEYINISGFDDRSYALSQQLIEPIRTKLDMKNTPYFDFISNLRLARSMKQSLFDSAIKMNQAADSDRILRARDFCSIMKEFNITSSRLLGYTYNPMAPAPVTSSQLVFVMLDVNAASLTSRCQTQNPFTLEEIKYFVMPTLKNVSYYLNQILIF